MGCSWSVFVTQTIGETQLERLYGLKTASRMRERGGRILVGKYHGPNTRGQQIYYDIYVDNLGIISVGEKQFALHLAKPLTISIPSVWSLMTRPSQARPQSPWELLSTQRTVAHTWPLTSFTG